jgi:hypothetical protein
MLGTKKHGFGLANLEGFPDGAQDTVSPKLASNLIAFSF